MEKYNNLMGEEWSIRFQPFLETSEFKGIGRKLKTLQNEGASVFPSFSDTFRAFKECPYNDLKVVMLTTNAYGKESDGLAFSSKTQTPILRKIFDAIEQDVADGLYLDRQPDLGRWANQGVLLLNLNLSADNGKNATYHVELWRPFMEYTMKVLESHTGIIYVLIGKDAEEYRHLIVESMNDVYLLEHPMTAVMKNRPWRHKSVFSDINRVSKFLNNTEIQWV